MDNSFLSLISHISLVFSFLPLLVSLVNFKYIKSFLVPLFALVAISAFIEILNKIHLESNQNNFYILHFFTVVEFTLISLFYYRFFKEYFKPNFLYALIFLFVLVAIIDYKINGLESIDNFSISIECILLTLYSLFLFYFVIKNLIFENLLAAPVFWINTGVLVYFSGNFILFVFSNYVMAKSLSTHYALWAIIHSFCNTSFNILLSIGFWKTRVR